MKDHVVPPGCPQDKLERLKLQVSELPMSRTLDEEGWDEDKVADVAERAFRRGFQHGFSAAEQMVGEIAGAQLVIHDMRFSEKEYPEFLHSFLHKMRD